MKVICLLFLIFGISAQVGVGQYMPPLPAARDGARPPAKEAERTKTNLWDLAFKLRKHGDLGVNERIAAVEVENALISVAYHLSIYLHLIDAVEISEKKGVAMNDLNEPLRKSAFEIARASKYQSEKCDYWLGAVKDKTLKEEILEGQGTLGAIADSLTHYFNGTVAQSTEEKPDGAEADSPQAREQSKAKEVEEEKSE